MGSDRKIENACGNYVYQFPQAFFRTAPISYSASESRIFMHFRLPQRTPHPGSPSLGSKRYRLRDCTQKQGQSLSRFHLVNSIWRDRFSGMGLG